MKNCIGFTFLAGLGLLAAGCGSHQFPLATSDLTRKLAADEKIEFQIDETGHVTTVEFHVAFGAADKEAFDAVKAVVDTRQTGEIVAAEIEFADGKRYYEVTKKDSSGKEHEYLCAYNPKTKTAKILEAEDVIDPSAAPEAVLRNANIALPGGTVTQVESISNADGDILEYHVKKTVDGKKYKIIVGHAGKVKNVFRETLAEAEVPVPFATPEPKAPPAAKETKAEKPAKKEAAPAKKEAAPAKK